MGLKLADAPRPCRRCKEDTHWRTQRGAAVHWGCEGFTERLTDEAYAQVVETAQLMLGGIASEPAPEHPYRQAHTWPLPIRVGACGWCLRPGWLLADADRYFHCAAHLFAPYRWHDAPEGGESAEQRR